MSSVIVVPYSEEWPDLFREVRQELLSGLSPVPASVEHIGSTSVPGLAAKPVIDVLLGASSLSGIESRIEPLEKLGYKYISKYEKEIPLRRYFVKAPASSLRLHVHGVELGSPIWQDHLAFRDRLRSDAKLRASYQSLKLQLAHEHSHDKSAYTAAKGPFIKAVLATANGAGIVE